MDKTAGKKPYISSLHKNNILTVAFVDNQKKNCISVQMTKP